MSHGTEHHVEEAHHAEHASHDPFDRRVATTMAIVAAVLACVVLLSHRSHNETLQNEIRSNDDVTLAANQWAYYQAKKIRQYAFEANAEFLAVMRKDMKTPEAAQEADDLIKKWQEKTKKWEGEAAQIEEKARDYEKEAAEFHKESEEAHHRSGRFDLGELGIELALVLCSVALLTKGRPYWYAGMAIGLAGMAVAITGFFLR
jgi:hypothetical protein